MAQDEPCLRTWGKSIELWVWLRDPDTMNKVEEQSRGLMTLTVGLYVCLCVCASMCTHVHAHLYVLGWGRVWGLCGSHTCKHAYTCALYIHAHTHKGKRIKRVGKFGLGSIFNGCHRVQAVAMAKPASWIPHSFQEDPVLNHLRLDIWPPERWEQTSLVLAQGWERVSDGDREHSVRSQPAALWGWVCSAGLEDWPCLPLSKPQGRFSHWGKGGVEGEFCHSWKM